MKQFRNPYRTARYTSDDGYKKDGRPFPFLKMAGPWINPIRWRVDSTVVES
jgi:hypothetical protein